MTIIDILRELFSATDEQTNAFSEAMKTNGIYTTSHENMDVRYPKLKADYDGVVQERDTSNATIAELKKAAKGQEQMQGIITNHEATIQQLQAQLQQEKLNSAIKVGLLSEKATDVSYLTFKLNEKLKEDNETLTLDDNGEIKGWKEKLDGLKTQFPTFFESSGDGNDGYEVYDVNKLRKSDGSDPTPTKETFRNMSFEKRMELREKNPTLYKQLRGN